MNCPNCGAAMRLALERESFQCDYCGTVEAPAAGDDGLKATGGVSERACPICHEGLEEVMGAAQILWRCGKCRGLLAPMEGFVALVGAMRAGREESGIVGVRPDGRDLERRIRCPGCGDDDDALLCGSGQCGDRQLPWMQVELAGSSGT